jgi:small-conductance mechanosensitive channel
LVIVALLLLTTLIIPRVIERAVLNARTEQTEEEMKKRADTRPSRQWEVAGELRLRIKKAFDQEGIEIPFPHTKVILENALFKEVTPKKEN